MLGSPLHYVDPMEQLALFAKYWQSGEVKTRLAASIGPVSAAEMHRRFLKALVQRLENLSCGKVIAFTPVHRRDEFAKLPGGSWTLEPQVEGDLGQRMGAFFEGAFRAGAARVVVLGSDSPSLPVDWVTRAFHQLRQNPVVLGPSADGGYYLLGMAASGRLPPIFEGIPWGTSAVRQLTETRLQEAGIQFSQLPDWYDVDHLDDLRRLHRELASAAHLDAALAALKPHLAEALNRVS
jgi:rSAM/selenodomain-associated transferase 1